MEFSELAARERLGWVFRRLGTAASTRPTPCYKPSGGSHRLAHGGNHPFLQVTHNAPSTTTTRPPSAAGAASTYSNPKRIRLARCSTTMTCTFRFWKIRQTALRRSFQPDPSCLHGFHLKTALG